MASKKTSVREEAVESSVRNKLVITINYPYRICYVRFVGSHQAYDRIDVTSG